MKVKTEAYYTGGGIWLATAPINDESYVLVDSQFPDEINVFKTVFDGDELVMDDNTFDHGAALTGASEAELIAYSKAIKELIKEGWYDR